MQGTRHRPDAVFMDKVALEAIRGKKGCLSWQQNLSFILTRSAYAGTRLWTLFQVIFSIGIGPDNE